MSEADVIIIGGGLAGLAAAHELAKRGKKAILLDQEGEQNLGGQAFWSLGGLMMIYFLVIPLQILGAENF